MFVYNNFLHDSRVQKEAETLTQAGYEVTVLALLDNKTTACDERNGVKISRVPATPWHLHFLKIFRSGHFFIFLLKKFFHNNQLLYSIALLIFLSEVLIFWVHKGFILQQRHIFYTFILIIAFCKIFFYNTFKSLGWTVPTNRQRFCKFFFYNTFKSLLMPFHRYFCFLSFYRNAYLIIPNGKYDFYHAHDLNTLLLAYLLARRDRSKLVYDSHELYVERNRIKKPLRLQKLALQKFESFLIRKAHAVFTVNDSIAEEMASRYKIPTPKVVMNTPIKSNSSDSLRLGYESLRDILSVPEGSYLLIYIGSITFNRGLEELIMSLKYLSDCYLVVMGYGHDPYKQNLEEIAQKSGVRQRFFFFGPVPTDDVIYYAAGADLGVAPIANACLSYYYCSPNKLFEYMNAGLPVISSNFPELEKVVLGHNIGLTFNPADPADIAKAARNILDDKPRNIQMKKNALKAASIYNWSNESKKLLEIYESI